jgi:hypothetical protein
MPGDRTVRGVLRQGAMAQAVAADVVGAARRSLANSANAPTLTIASILNDNTECCELVAHAVGVAPGLCGARGTTGLKQLGGAVREFCCSGEERKRCVNLLKGCEHRRSSSSTAAGIERAVSVADEVEECSERLGNGEVVVH